MNKIAVVKNLEDLEKLRKYTNNRLFHISYGYEEDNEYTEIETTAYFSLMFAYLLKLMFYL